MAVTQQLARVPAEYLDACRRAAGASSDGDHRWDPPECDVLDLDWAPVLLERVGEVAGLDEGLRAGLQRAVGGDAALDLGFLHVHPHAIGPFGPAPTGVSAVDVARVAELLGRIDMAALLAGLPGDDREAASVLGHGAEGISGGLRTYLLEHFDALCGFYREAARRRLLVVLWAD